MKEYEVIKNNDQLARRLRAEARRSRPEFSAALHERVLAAIQAAPATIADGRARRGSLSRAFAWSATAAASVALTIALAMVVHVTRSKSPDHTAGAVSGPKRDIPAAIARPESATKKDSDDFDSAAEELASSASGISDWVISTAGDGQWAGLDRDAQRALATVAAPLPFDVTFSVASAHAE